MTSFDVIRKLQRNLPHAIGKIGHFGTLDPFAQGVLLIGIGPATRLNRWTQDLPKEYIATGFFGKKTPTGDLTVEDDQIFHDENFSSASKEDVEIALKSFLGKYQQVPHQYSATKFEGKALYEWAREGVEIKKDPVEREIYDIELLELNASECKFRVVVSSGTYIRVLFEDLAKKLGTFGVLGDLVRTKVGHQVIEDSVKQESWPTSFEDSDDFLENEAKSINSLVEMSSLDLDEKQAKSYTNGVKIRGQWTDGTYWILSNKLILGLGKVCDGVLVSEVNFQPPASMKIDLTIRNSLKKSEDV
jgi:tRNA pseudouridine55 synthase